MPEVALLPLRQHFASILVDLEPEFVAHGNANVARAVAGIGPAGVDFLLRIRDTHRDNRPLLATVAEGLCVAESRPEEVRAALADLASIFVESPDLHARISQRISAMPSVYARTTDERLRGYVGGVGTRIEILRMIDMMTIYLSDRDPNLYLPHLSAILAATLAGLREEAPGSVGHNSQASEVLGLLCRVAKRFGDNARSLAGDLATLLGHPAFPPTQGVDRDIIQALGELGDPSVVPRLLPYLRDPSASNAARTAIALGRLRSPDAIGGLLEALTDNRHRIRRDAAEALGRIGVASETVLESLTVAKADPESSVRNRADRAYKKLTAQAGVTSTEDPEE